MRADAVYALIVAAMEGIAVDQATTQADRFHHEPGQEPEEAHTQRGFVIRQGQLGASSTFVPKTVSTVLRVVSFYVDDPTVGLLIALDGERVLSTLAPLAGNATYLGLDGQQHAIDPDFYAVDQLGDWVPVKGIYQPEASVDIRVRYRLTGV